MPIWTSSGSWGQWRNSWGGQSAPDIFHWEVFAEKTGKNEARKKGGKGNMERKRRKISNLGRGGKIENGRGEGMKMSRMSRVLCLFVCLCVCLFFCIFAGHFLKPLQFVWGLPKWTIFTGKNHISHWEKIRKTYFAPSKKYSSLRPWLGSNMFILTMLALSHVKLTIYKHFI